MTIYQCDCSTGVDERRIEFVKGHTICSTCCDNIIELASSIIDARDTPSLRYPKRQFKYAMMDINGDWCDQLADTVTYCQYGDTRMKPTDLWCSDSLFQQWTPRPMCKNGDP